MASKHCTDEHHFQRRCLSKLAGRRFSLRPGETGRLAFLDVPLIVRLDRVNQWQREAEKRWCSPDDVFLDYCERYTFENADGCVSSSDQLLEYVRGLGWKVQANMQPIPFTAASLESLCEKVSGTLKLQRFQTPFRTGSEELVYAIPQKRPSLPIRLAQPAVTVAVSHYNLGRFLPETLASLARADLYRYGSDGSR